MKILDDFRKNNVSIWLDSLSRKMIHDGSLKDFINNKQVVGITTNPTIFYTSISESNMYDDYIKQLKLCCSSTEEIIRALMVRDIRETADLFHSTYLKSNKKDGRVSIEVTPSFAYNADATIAEAEYIHNYIDRDNIFVKIPATSEGLIAIENTIAKGISVNVTLIFDVTRYSEVVNAFFNGLEKAYNAGLDISNIYSVASVFVSRWDSEVDKLLEQNNGNDFCGKVAINNAGMIYKIYKEIFNSNRWNKLKNYGASEQRVLWASTGVKNKLYNDDLYTTHLIANNTVNTMPINTFNALLDHGAINNTLQQYNVDVIEKLKTYNIDYYNVAKKLELDGVSSFKDSWNKLYNIIDKFK